MTQERIISLSKGTPKTRTVNGNLFQSAIWKEETDLLQVRFDGILGDQVANRKFHGGPDRVVCLYPFEHYAHWQRELGIEPSVSAFGENICAAGMREDQVCIGDVFQIGDAVLQVSQGRYPCATINIRNQHGQLLNKIIETGYTGYFFRVLEEGDITPDAKIKKISAHPLRVTVAAVHHLYFHEKTPRAERIRELLAMDELAEPWRQKLRKKLEQQEKGSE